MPIPVAIARRDEVAGLDPTLGQLLLDIGFDAVAVAIDQFQA
jgi:hypothetical protein